jgi:hypothetical protein
MQHVESRQAVIVAGHLIVWIENRLFDGRANGECRTGVFAEYARLDIANSDRAAGLVQCAGAGDRVRAESQFTGDFRPQWTYGFPRLAILRELVFRDMQLLQHLRPPGARSEIPITGGCHQGTFTHIFAG